MNTKVIILILFVLFISTNIVSANEMDDVNATLICDESPIEIVDDIEQIDENSLLESDIPRISSQNSIQCCDDNIGYSDSLQSSSQDSLQSNAEYIVVNNWDELQYYCAQTDKDYILKLKENTNFYPTDPHNPSYQIKIKNNVKIIGSEGSYIGDSSPNARDIMFVSFLVEDNSLYGSLNFENVTFKYILSVYSTLGAGGTRDGIFIQMGGIRKNTLTNCIFHNVISKVGHATIVYLKRGSLL